MKNLKVGDRVKLKPVNECYAARFNGRNIGVSKGMINACRGEICIEEIHKDRTGNKLIQGLGWSVYSTQWVSHKIPVLESYEFRDSLINFSKVSDDALEDGKVAWIIIGKEKSYVGLMRSVFVEEYLHNVSFSVSTISPYAMFAVDKVDTGWWIEKLKEYTIEYNNMVEVRDLETKDRSRVKGKVKFKVLTFE